MSITSLTVSVPWRLSSWLERKYRYDSLHATRSRRLPGEFTAYRSIMRYLTLCFACFLVTSVAGAEVCSIALRVVDFCGKAVPVRVANLRNQAGEELGR